MRIPHSGRPAIQKSHNLYAVLGQFTLFYGRNRVITASFNQTIQELQATDRNTNNGMPPTISQAGHAFTTPSKNAILGGRQKTKKRTNAHYADQPNIPLLFTSKDIINRK